jgi:lysophospholipase L1-like esterase
VPRSGIVLSVRIVVVVALVAGCNEKSATPPKEPLSRDVARLDRLVEPRPNALALFEAKDVDRPPTGVATAKASPASPESPASPGAPASVLPVIVLEPPPVGYLERRDHLGRFFEALARLEGGQSNDDARIVQYGDSHTASDTGTSVFRRALQARFGDGGRGFVSLGRPWKSYVQDGVHGGMTDGFEPLRVKFQAGSFTGLDGHYGLLGVGIGASKEGERAWTQILARSSRLEVDYWQAPTGGSFDLFIDGMRAGHVATRAQQAASGYAAFDLADAPHQVEVRTSGDGEVIVFGMTLDRAQAGLVVDALGINGAQIFTPLRWNEEHFAEQLRHRAPDLVVLAYGTNESLESKLADADYERGLVDFLGRIARATPNASCLLLGPPDRGTRAHPRDPWASAPRIAEIAQIQRRVALSAGCAFYDQLQAMGGPGSIVAWASEAEPRAARDHVHLTRTGYAQLAASFANDLMQAYDDWRTERGLRPKLVPRTWGVAAR